MNINMNTQSLFDVEWGYDRGAWGAHGSSGDERDQDTKGEIWLASPLS